MYAKGFVSLMMKTLELKDASILGSDNQSPSCTIQAGLKLMRSAKIGKDTLMKNGLKFLSAEKAFLTVWLKFQVR
jgi:hypothetical protein